MQKTNKGRIGHETGGRTNHCNEEKMFHQRIMVRFGKISLTCDKWSEGALKANCHANIFKKLVSLTLKCISFDVLCSFACNKRVLALSVRTSKRLLQATKHDTSH